jgi:hypothetical protein
MLCAMARLARGVLALWALGTLVAPAVPRAAAEGRPQTAIVQRLEEDLPTLTVPRPLPGREHFQVKLTPGYEQGDYDAPGTTEIFAVPLTLRYLGDRWDVSGTFSYLHVESPGDVTLVAGQPVPVQGAAGRRRVDQGFGDIVLKGRYYLVQDSGELTSLPSLTPLLRLKIPTADSPELGTGEPDFGFGVEWDKTFGRSFIVFGDVTYTIIGEPPDQDFRNRPGASIGAGYRVSELVTVSAMLDWRRAISRRQTDPVDLLGFVSFRMTPTFVASPYVSVGLTSGAADVGVGVELSYKFGRY